MSADVSAALDAPELSGRRRGRLTAGGLATRARVRAEGGISDGLASSAAPRAARR
ncbi:hypothetical protein [Parafrankia sp. EUN1f]|uniref:hypothetical protein n=1 Tax=Parafrankia sp. EUN1f TaxID=102897 RepID=UPI0001C445CE|nr:hypothetical protein [Parafrankia sp. EUN1f]EFC86714.1 hypothetical protein FrEUN1fDRAFT_0196 [Parafrankia sp. EUN1f]